MRCCKNRLVKQKETVASAQSSGISEQSVKVILHLQMLSVEQNVPNPFCKHNRTFRYSLPAKFYNGAKLL
jgi:hypothetical protein